MRAILGFAVTIVATTVVYGGTKYPEVIGEDISQPRLHWTLPPQKAGPTHFDPERDYNDYMKWRFQFLTASDQRLGSFKDLAAIQRELHTSDPRVRWVSHRIVVASANGFLYVVEKHHSAWEVTHRYGTRQTQLYRW